MPFYRYVNWGLNKLTLCPKVTKLVSAKLEFQPCLPSEPFPSPLPLTPHCKSFQFMDQCVFPREAYTWPHSSFCSLKLTNKKECLSFWFQFFSWKEREEKLKMRVPEFQIHAQTAWRGPENLTVTHTWLMFLRNGKGQEEGKHWLLFEVGFLQPVQGWI